MLCMHLHKLFRNPLLIFLNVTYIVLAGAIQLDETDKQQLGLFSVSLILSLPPPPLLSVSFALSLVLSLSGCAIRLCAF